MKKIIYTLLICTYVTMGAFNSVYAQPPGTPDVTFGGTGIVTTNIGIGDDKGYAVIQQTDSKLVVAGLSGNGTNNDFGVTRYNVDGSLDNTFDTDGMVTTPIGPGNDHGQSLIQQVDGKILVAGFTSNGTNNDFALVRYNVNGSLDNTFGVGGIVTTAIGSSVDQGHSVALQSDGKIIVSGFSSNGINTDFALARYNVNGSLDITFDTDGIVTTDFSSSDDVGRSVAIQTDGKIVVTGWSSNGINLDFAIARYDTTGSLDNTFGVGGMVTNGIGALDDQGYSIRIQTDGKILVAGSTNNGTDQDFAMVRYNTNGSLDNLFGVGGIVTTDFFVGDDICYSINLQPDGKILMAGVCFNITHRDFCIARYTTNGSLDISFDTDGRVNTDISGGANHDAGWSVVIQSDERVVVTGNGSLDGISTEFGTVRYNICEFIDTSIFQSGATLTSIDVGPYQWVNCDSAYSAISGETNQDYTATSNGNYAVIIGTTNCLDTSGCYNINLFSISENSFAKTIIIYPNPTDGQLILTVNSPLSNASIKLLSITGQTIMKKDNLNGSTITFDISELASGIYYLEIMDGINIARTKVVKK